jgi:hypothetical protein
MITIQNQPPNAEKITASERTTTLGRSHVITAAAVHVLVSLSSRELGSAAASDAIAFSV